MAHIKLDTVEEFFIKIHNMFIYTTFIKVEKIMSILPQELNTPAKKTYIKTFGNNITKLQYIKFLKHMTHGGDYISFDYLIKHYKLEINKDTNMVQLTNKLCYKDINQEALFMWWLFRIIKQDAFIGQYFNQDKLHIIRQQAIESNILPTNSNFKFDFGFNNLNILLEINEYSHEHQVKVEEDLVKNNLVILCGYKCITLKIANVFGIPEVEFNKLSNEEAHVKLATSTYLKSFTKDFIYKITSALLKFKDVRDAYILKLFREMLYSKMQSIIYRAHTNISNKNNIKTLIKTNLFTDNDLLVYNKLELSIDLDKNMLEDTKQIVTGLGSSGDFIDLFNIKNMCVLNNNANIITYKNITKLLKIKKQDNSSFILYIYNLIPTIPNINIKASEIYINWQDLAEIINNFDKSTKLNNMLQMYYREVDKSYEIIISMIKSHTDSLQSNKDILTTYINSANKKLLNVIETLELTNKAHINKKDKVEKINKNNIKQLLDEIIKFKCHNNNNNISTIQNNQNILDLSNVEIIDKIEIDKQVLLVINQFNNKLMISNNYNSSNSSDDSCSELDSD